jgi:hypothetical protein
MNINDFIDELITELAYRLDSGIPDLKNKQHLSVLSEILTEWGMNELETPLILTLLGEDKEKEFKNPDLNKVITYKNVNGEKAKGKVGNLLRRPKEEDAYIQATSALGGEDSDRYKTAMDDLGGEGQPNRDIEGEREKRDDEKGDEPKEEPQTGTALNPNTKGGADWNKNLPDGDVAKIKKDEKDSDDEEDELSKSEKKKSDTKVYSDREIKKEMEKLNDIDAYLKDSDDDTKNRAEILKNGWNKYVNAKTREEKIEALRELAENNLIEAHMGGKKIYLSPNTALPYKMLTGGGSEGTAITREMNELIREGGIDLPARGNAKDRALADMSGKHNEAGVVAYLFSSDENKKSYQQTQKAFSELGGDESRFDEINKKAAESIKSQLPEGAKVTNSQQVGGIGKTALSALGIDPKVDPTDLIVYYVDSEGKEQLLKVSAKTYSDPKNITMKNSGTGAAGKTYLGDIGEEIDNQIGAWRAEFAWDDSMDDEEKADKKRRLKQTYLKAFSEKMVELTQSEDGQKRLIQMWKDVHGCGHNVYTQIINKNTGDVTIKPPDYYCDPKPPFKVEFDGVKLVINMGGQDDKFLQIDMKTEDKGSPKLLFRHRSK